MKALLRNGDRDLASAVLEAPADEREAKALQRDAQDTQGYFCESLIASRRERVE
jgi:hypothetical protein